MCCEGKKRRGKIEMNGGRRPLWWSGEASMSNPDQKEETRLERSRACYSKPRGACTKGLGQEEILWHKELRRE